MYKRSAICPRKSDNPSQPTSDLISYKKFNLYSKFNMSNFPSVPQNNQVLTVIFLREELSHGFRFYLYSLCVSVMLIGLSKHEIRVMPVVPSSISQADRLISGSRYASILFYSLIFFNCLI